MVAIERARSGRPSIDIGMPPSPIALTVCWPMVRCCMGCISLSSRQGVLRSCPPSATRNLLVGPDRQDAGVTRATTTDR